jgi:tRNA-modifying protein YgfZ
MNTDISGTVPPPSKPPASGRLPHLGLLRFSGPDAQSFLQGQVSNDTRRLAEGQSLLAAYSSPQGRVLAIMHLLPHSGGIAAVLPRDLISPTMESLRRFVLRAKVKIEDGGEVLSVAGHHGAAGQHGARSLQSAGITAPPPNGGYMETDGIGVAAVNGDPSRYWVIGAAETLAERGLAGDTTQAENIERDWRLADIRAGLPQIYLSTRETFVAHMLNLDLLDGISFNKGCYTGQEIIARTQHLGRIKRRLYRLHLPPGDWSIGGPLQLSDGRSGRLVEVVRIGDGFEALAVLNMQASAGADGGPSSAAESADGDAGTSATVAATPLPLPYEV